MRKINFENYIHMLTDIDKEFADDPEARDYHKREVVEQLIIGLLEGTGQRIVAAWRGPKVPSVLPIQMITYDPEKVEAWKKLLAEDNLLFQKKE